MTRNAPHATLQRQLAAPAGSTSGVHIGATTAGGAR
jgi:hypothetical protein